MISLTDVLDEKEPSVLPFWGEDLMVLSSVHFKEVLFLVKLFPIEVAPFYLTSANLFLIIDINNKFKRNRRIYSNDAASLFNNNPWKNGVPSMTLQPWQFHLNQKRHPIKYGYMSVKNFKWWDEVLMIIVIIFGMMPFIQHLHSSGAHL